MLRRDLGGRAALIEFAGAPYTVASYLIEGRPSRGATPRRCCTATRSSGTG